eukprot:g5630.t1
MRSEIGLEEFITRTSNQLSETRSNYELITELNQRRSRFRSILQSTYNELDPDEFMKQCSSHIRSLRNLNCTNVEIAQRCYDSYDSIINELDQRIALYQQTLSIPEAVSHIKPAVHETEESEPRYCFCGDVAYGRMIRCDNPNCPIQWFHFQCLDENGFDPPDGNWLCPQCRPVTSTDGI